MAQIGRSEVERIICSAEAFGAIDDIQPRNLDAWQITFPGLDSLSPLTTANRETKLRVCIATEEISGPVRNGGIGTTYAYLAESLAKIGCDVTILYLRGGDVENGTVDDWVAHYDRLGVKFVPAPNYTALDRFQTGADRWLKAPYNMMRYLLDHPMDVVHVSEWRGSGYLSLLAKRQGLAFAQTLFIVKSSSPWLWNRLYGAQPLDRLDDLSRMHAERQSIELADMVIGGSLHLLRWMASQGYRIPRERTFVQPNLVRFDHLQPLMSRRAHQAGERIPVEEIVFFGRLEARKGLFIFCHAIARLIRLGVALPETITFMGKPGESQTARPDQGILDYIDQETKNWPCKVRVLSNLQQFEALEYLLAQPRLAVMPSIIENSSLAVYEAANCGIPFIASNTGGTPELVAPEDHERVLCNPHPVPLAEKLAEALRSGAYIAQPSFSNDRNLQIWEDFHRHLASGLLEPLLARSAPDASEGAGVDSTFSVCINHTGEDAALRTTLASLTEQHLPPLEVIVAVDADDLGALKRAQDILRDSGIPGAAIEASDFDVGLAYNAAAQKAKGDFGLFIWSGVALRPEALRALATVARTTGADLVNCFYRVVYKPNSEHSDYLHAGVLGSFSESFFRTDLTAKPLAMRLSAFRAVEGFTTDYRVLGAELELIARTQIKGLACATALMELASVPGFEEAWLRDRGYDPALGHFRLIRPQISAVPLALRDLLLLARGMQLKPHRFSRVRKAQKRKNLTSRLLSALKGDLAQTGVTRLQMPDTDISALARHLDGEDGQPARRHSKHAALSRPMLYRLPSAEMNEIFSGQLFGLRRGVLYGWVRNEADPETPVSVSVFVDGVLEKTIRADRNLDAAAPLPPDVAGHGFAVRVGAPLRILDRFRTKHIRLGVGANNGITLGEATVGLSSLAAAGYEGCCDANKYGVLHGWIWRRGHPDAAVDVTVFVDGRVLARLTASSTREDIALAGIGRGDHAFRLQIPKQLRDGARRRIEVVTADSGLPLSFGALVLKGDRITPV